MKTASSSPTLLRNMISGTLSATVAFLIAAACYPVYLKYLGYHTYGLWILLSTVISFAQLGNLGMSQALCKRVAEECATSRPGEIVAYISTAMIFLAGCGAVLVSIALLFRRPLVRLLGLGPEDAAIADSLLPALAALTAYIFMVDTTGGVLAGLGRIDLSNYLTTAGQALTLSLSTALLILRPSLWDIIGANAIASLIVHAVSLVLITRILGMVPIDPRACSKAHARRLVAIGGSMAGATLIALLLSPFNKLVLARFGSLSALPLYDLAFTGGMRLRGLIDTAQRALMPEVSRIVAAPGITAPGRLARACRRGVSMLILAVPLYAALMILAEPMLKAWLGPRYDPALPQLVRITLCGTFCSLLGAPAFYVLLGLGQARTLLLANIVQSGLNVMLVAVCVASHARISASSLLLLSSISMGIASLYLICKMLQALRSFSKYCSRTFSAISQTQSTRLAALPKVTSDSLVLEP